MSRFQFLAKTNLRGNINGFIFTYSGSRKFVSTYCISKFKQCCFELKPYALKFMPWPRDSGSKQILLDILMRYYTFVLVKECKNLEAEKNLQVRMGTGMSASNFAESAFFFSTSNFDLRHFCSPSIKINIQQPI